MAKLIVSKFDRFRGLRTSCFYRIIGSVLEYNYENGNIKLISLLDNSICNIELNLESEIGSNNGQSSMFYEGLVVDINVVSIIKFDNISLYANLINIVNLPGTLIDFKDTLIKFSDI